MAKHFVYMYGHNVCVHACVQYLFTQQVNGNIDH